MSKSFYKSNSDKGVFLRCNLATTNKKDKQHCNRLFRRISKSKLYNDYINDDLDNHVNINKVQEAYNNYLFASDGLKVYWKLTPDRKYPYTRRLGNYYEITETEIKKSKMK